ncbi:MAG TPA: VOC family protein [Bryobacteraceae bacterium]|nr:VOC family protein [Bryobacteraceae bacterium]
MAWIEETLAAYPTAAFQDRLREELERSIRMQSTATYVRAGFTAITPYLTVREIDRLIEFAKQVFGAEETYRGTGSAGGTHCELRIGDSMIMCGGGPAVSGSEKPATLHVYVPDTDAVYQRALAAGATSIAVPEDKPYGARQGSVQDPTGNRWVIATHEGPLDEPQRTVTPFLVPPENALGLIGFIKAVFGAREMGLYQSPEGKLQYAALVVGDAVLEFGEAPGFPRPALLLYVPDADATYRKALQAGATSVLAPTDQPYGDRMGTIEDAWGNTWYVAQHLA